MDDNSDPFTDLLNKHKKYQENVESNNSQSKPHSHNNNNNRFRGRGRGRGNSGHRGGGNFSRGSKRPREEDASDIRARYLSRIKLDTPEDIEKWIADRKKNFPGNIPSNDENGSTSNKSNVNNPLGLIQDYSSDESEEDDDDENINTKKECLTEQNEQTTDQVENDDHNPQSVSNNDTSLNSIEVLNENIPIDENQCDNEVNEKNQEDDDAEPPEFQTSHQTYQPKTKDHTIPNEENSDSTKLCRFIASGRRCFKGKKCPFLHTKPEKSNQPNHKPTPSQYKRKDLINLLQNHDIEKDAEALLQSLRYLYNNGYLN